MYTFSTAKILEKNIDKRTYFIDLHEYKDE